MSKFDDYLAKYRETLSQFLLRGDVITGDPDPLWESFVKALRELRIYVYSLEDVAKKFGVYTGDTDYRELIRRTAV